MDNHQNIGLGCRNFNFAVYIANRPPLYEYQSLDQLTALTSGEITAIGQQCGNGWRKVFNVYAKVLYALKPQQFLYRDSAATWQQFRDQHLLQPNSNTALLFSPPQLTDSTNSTAIHLIIGRTYAKSLVNSGQLTVPLTWLDNEFAINHQHRLIVCPYFDYRQLSNIKIERLALMISQL